MAVVLTTVEVDLARRSVVLTGTVANMNEVFGAELLLFLSQAGVFRGRVATLSIPVKWGTVPVVAGEATSR